MERRYSWRELRWGVQAGLKGTVLDGVVRGPGSVELTVRGQGDWGKP
jgi:hypothetical protein